MEIKDNFLRLKYDALFKLDVSLTEFVLLSYIASYKGVCYATNKTLSMILKLKPRQVRTLLGNLKTKGYIEIDNPLSKKRIISLSFNIKVLLRF